MELADILLKVRKSPPTPRVHDSTLYQSLRLKAGSLAEGLATRRHYVHAGLDVSPQGDSGGAEYDPRFLFFEFSCNIVLREAQVCAQFGGWELILFFMNCRAFKQHLT